MLKYIIFIGKIAEEYISPAEKQRIIIKDKMKKI
jgi:hypothetical protein